MAPFRFAASLQVGPNPVRDVAHIRIQLLQPARVKLEIYDLQGRRIVTLGDDRLRPAGVFDLPVRTDGWPAGVYYCRFENAGQSGTTRLAVVK